MTIGKHLEDTVYELAEKGHVLQATVLDAIGSSAVERVADFVQGKIRDMASREGFVISRRFSPGHCDWDVCQQREVFKAVDGDMVGIHLTDQYLMVPQKSISSIVGIGPSDGDVRDYNPCATCDRFDCVGRKVRPV